MLILQKLEFENFDATNIFSMCIEESNYRDRLKKMEKNFQKLLDDVIFAPGNDDSIKHSMMVDDV